MDPGHFYGEHFTSNAQRMADVLGVNVRAPMHKINIIGSGRKAFEIIGPSKFLPNYTFLRNMFVPR